MNEISIIFYGDGSQIRNHLLSLLQVVRIMPATDTDWGFYIVEKKFGQETKRKISLDLNDPASDSLLVYRYLSEEEKELLRRNAGQKRVYVLLHQYMDLEYVKENVISVDASAHFIAGTNPGAAVRHFSSLRKSLKTKNLFFIETVAKSEPKKEAAAAGQNIPVFLLFLAKVLFNPFSEIRRFFEMMKHSNLRMLNRFVELIFFFDFLFKILLRNPLVWLARTLYYNLIFIGGLLRVGAIKIGFGIRHLLLMMGFKSFGVFVDGFNCAVKAKDIFLHIVFYRGLKEFFYRILNVVWYRWGYVFFYKVIVRGYVAGRHSFGMVRVHLIRAAYYVRHFFLMLLSFLYVRVVLRVYYGLIYFLYYRVFYTLYYTVIRGLFDFLRFQVRHVILMTFYKSYGLIVDVSLAVWRFTKLVLLYPVRKLYWFMSFQYEKRLKRYFSGGA